MCPQQDAEQMELAALKAIVKSAKILESPKKFKPLTPEEQKKVDSRSVHMGNVDWNSTVEEIEKFFLGCGSILRVTIPKDRFTKRQKNYAFIEFDSVASATTALTMDKSEFRGRFVSVVPKRTNKPNFHGANFHGAHNKRHGQTVVVKYVYVNGPKKNFSKRFAPYSALSSFHLCFYFSVHLFSFFFF